MEETADISAFVQDKRSLLEKLLGAAPVPHRVVVYPEGSRMAGGQVALTILSVHDQMQSAAAAITYLRDVAKWRPEDLIEELGRAAVELECRVQWLFRCLRDPKDLDCPIVKDPDQLRKLSCNDDLAWLWEQYLDFSAERSTFKRAQTWEEVEALVESVGKGRASPTLLSDCDSDTLRNIVRLLAVRYTTLMRTHSFCTSSATSSMNVTPSKE